MTLRDLIRELFTFFVSTNTEVKIRIVRRDENHIITHEQILDIASIYNPSNKPICLNIEENELKNQWREV